MSSQRDTQSWAQKTRKPRYSIPPTIFFSSSSYILFCSLFIITTCRLLFASLNIIIIIIIYLSMFISDHDLMTNVIYHVQKKLSQYQFFKS